MTGRPRVLLVADDLTGAADTAVAFAARGLPTQVSFGSPAAYDGSAVLAVDTDTRRAGPADARRLVAAAVAVAPRARVVYKKIDSTLRGNVGVETAAAFAASDARLGICVPAFPGTGRVTVGGVQYAGGRPVGEVAPLFAAVEAAASAVVPLAVVRSGGLAAALDRAVDAGAGLVVVDAETDADLDAVAAAGLARAERMLWVGSGGLGAALARALAAGADPPGPDAQPRADGPVLVVVGSGTPVAVTQARAVAATGAAVVPFPAPALLRGEPAAVFDAAAQAARRLRAGDDVLVVISEGAAIPPRGGRVAAATLARALAAGLSDVHLPSTAMIATGGETARLLAAELGATGLTLAGELEPGIAVGRLVGGPGCPIVVKAGGFGDERVLVRALDRLHSAPAPAPVR